MRYPLLVQLIVATAATFGMAAGGQVTPPESAAFLHKVAGVYKNQFQNSFVNGEKYESEDILEVVDVDDHAAYVRMDLEFYNGHSGRIYGVATYKKSSLVYDNGKPGDERCIVEYVWSGDAVVTHADYDKTPGCLFYHGARGSLDGVSFSVKKRQEIRYMDRLRNSREFKEAWSGYGKIDGSNANPRP